MCYSGVVALCFLEMILFCTQLFLNVLCCALYHFRGTGIRLSFCYNVQHWLMMSLSGDSADVYTPHCHHLCT